MVSSWMDDVFEWTTPSRREHTRPPRGCTWVDPPSPGMTIVLTTGMMTEATTEIMVSGAVGNN